MDQDVIDLREYVAALRRRWVSLLLVVVLTTGSALAVSLLQTPLYEGETELVIEPLRRSQEASLGELLQRDETVETERRVIESSPVRERVVEQLGGDVDELGAALSTSVVPNSRVVRILVTDEDPVRAAALANAMAEAYLTFRREQALDTLLAAQSGTDERITEVRAELDDLDARIARSVGQDRTQLEIERQSLLGLLGTLVAQRGELGDTGDVVGGGTVISPADVPNGPVSPRPLRTGVLALVLGGMLGVGLALLRDHLDDAVRSDDDVRRATGDRPVLGRIPRWQGEDNDQRLVTMLEPHGTVAEAFSVLATSLKYVAVGDGSRRGQVVVVSSAGPAEGKTTIAANLAVAAARAGRRTVLLDADLRRPTIARRFGMPNGSGLSDAVAGGGEDPTGLQEIAGLPLSVMPSGPVPPNPADLVSSASMRRLLDTAREHAELVVVDSPPLLAVADAIELGAAADAIVLVVRAEVTHRRSVEAALESLESVGVEVAGVVVNGVDPKANRYGYYGYGYQPATPDSSERPSAVSVRGSGWGSPTSAAPDPQPTAEFRPDPDPQPTAEPRPDPDPQPTPPSTSTSTPPSAQPGPVSRSEPDAPAPAPGAPVRARDWVDDAIGPTRPGNVRPTQQAPASPPDPGGDDAEDGEKALRSRLEEPLFRRSGDPRRDD